MPGRPCLANGFEAMARRPLVNEMSTVVGKEGGARMDQCVVRFLAGLGRGG